MKKVGIVLVVLVLMGVHYAMAQKVAVDAKEGTVSIRGKIGTINAPQQLWIYMGENKWDSIPVKDGAFSYTKTTMLPAYGAIMVKYKPYYPGVEGHTNFFGSMDLKSLFFEEGSMTINSPKDSLKGFVSIEGSSIQDKQERWLAQRRAISARERTLAAQFDKASPEQLQSEDFLQNYEVQTAALHASIDSLMRTQVLLEGGSLVTQIAFLEYLRTREGMLDPKTTQNIFDLFPDGYKNSPIGQNAQTLVAGIGQPKEVVKIPDVGEPALAFTQNNPDGKPVSMEQFKGKYVLLDFWASWCVPCRKINPDLLSLYHEFKAGNFTIVGISLDDDKTKWQKAIVDDKLEWTQVSDLQGWKNDIATKYGIQAIPQNVLVDPDGQIVAKNLSIGDLRTKLSTLDL